jgi:hypothetical protein
MRLIRPIRRLLPLVIEMCEPRRLLATWVVPGLTSGADTVAIVRTGAGSYQATVNAVPVTQTSVTAIVVNSGDGNDSITLNSSDVPVTVSGGNGDDTFDIAFASLDYRNVTAAVTFNGDAQTGSNGDYVRVWGAGITTGTTPSLSPTSATVPGFGGLTYAAAERLLLSLGSGSDIVSVEGTGATLRTDIFGNDGNDVVALAPTSQDLGSVNDPIYFDGGGNTPTGRDVLLAYDNNFALGTSYSFDGSLLTLGVVSGVGATINFVESIDLRGSQGPNTFTLSALPDPMALNFEANGGSDTLQITGAASIAGQATLVGGAGADTFFDDAATSGIVQLWVNRRASDSAIVINHTGAWTTRGVVILGEPADKLKFSSAAAGTNIQLNANVPMAVTMTGGAGSDTLGVNERDLLTQPINFDGAGGANFFTFRTSGVTTVPMVLRTDRLEFGSTPLVQFTSVATFVWSAGVLNVESLAASQNLFMPIGSGPATLRLAAGTGDLTNIQGNIADYDPTNEPFAFSQHYIEFWDNSRHAGYNYTISPGTSPAAPGAFDQYKQLAIPGGGTVTWSMGQITMALGNGDDTVTVNLGRCIDTYKIMAGSGNDTLRVVNTTLDPGTDDAARNIATWFQLGGSSLWGGAGNDRMIVDDSASGAYPSYYITTSGSETRVERTHVFGSSGPPTTGFPAFHGIQDSEPGDLLEVRTSPSGSTVNIGSNVAPLLITGGNGPDTITSGLAGGVLGRVTIEGGGAADSITLQRSDSDAITVRGGAGDDVLSINTDGAGTARAVTDAADTWASWTFGNGSGLTIAPGGIIPTIKQLNVPGSTSFIDIADGGLIVDYPTSGPTQLPLISSGIQTGYSGGAWTGLGIRSSTAAATPNRGIGFGESSFIFPTAPRVFAGQTVDATSVLLRYTLSADANLDRTVNFDDLLRLAASYNATGSGWSQGDFNYDGRTNFDDLLTLASNYNTTLPALLTAPAPPSPNAPDDDDAGTDVLPI